MKDQLYQTEEANLHEAFAFDERVVEVFDDMVMRSVPNYQSIQTLLAELAVNLNQERPIYDLGCSTGNTIDAILNCTRAKAVPIIGIDSSEAMVEKCRARFEGRSDKSTVTILRADLLQLDNLPAGEAGVVILCLTMQFMRPLKRGRFLRMLCENLTAGGSVLLVEKTIERDPLLNGLFIELYHAMKARMGYSDLEISKKRQALENKLIPFYDDENIGLLREAGFTAVTQFFGWLNFKGFIAKKA